MNEPFEHEKRDDPYTTPQHRGNSGTVSSGGSCLKMGVVWGLPAIVVPLIMGLFMSVWPIGLTLAVGFLLWMGKMQATDSMTDSGAGTNTQWGRVVLYVVVQVILIPLVWFAVAWGFCAISGSGSFK